MEKKEKLHEKQYNTGGIKGKESKFISKKLISFSTSAWEGVRRSSSEENYTLLNTLKEVEENTYLDINEEKPKEYSW